MRIRIGILYFDADPDPAQQQSDATLRDKKLDPEPHWLYPGDPTFDYVRHL